MGARSIWFPGGLEDQIKQQAAALNLSFSAYVVRALQDLPPNVSDRVEQLEREVATLKEIAGL